MADELIPPSGRGNAWARLRGELLDRRHLRRAVGNTGWLFADRMIRLGVGLVVGVAVARYLGPERFGVLNYAISFVSLFSVFATLGLESIVVRDLVRNAHRRDEVLGTTFALRLIGGATAAALGTVSIWVLRPGDDLMRWLVLLVAAGTIFQAVDVVDYWFQSQMLSKYAVYSRMAAFLVTSAIRVALIVVKAPVIAFAAAMLAELALSAVMLLVTYRRLHPDRVAWRWNPEVVRSSLSESWPVMVAGVAVLVQARIDQVMLGELLGAESVGQYSAALRTVEFFAFLPLIIHSTVAPTVTSAKQRSEEAYHQRLLNIYRLMFIVSVGTAVPLYLLSKPIIHFLYGAEYAAAGALLGLMSIRVLLANFGVAKGLFIVNDGLFRFSLVTSVVGAVVNLAANYLLIPPLGAVGAVWAGFTSFTVTIFIVDLTSAKARRNLRLMALAMVTPWKFQLH